MVKKQHKVLSLILCLILAVSAVCAGTVGALAASGDTVYCKLNNGWNKVYAYMWGDSIGDNHAWPGVEMTKVEGDVYSYNITDEYDKIIFNNGQGNGSNQTGNLNYEGNGKIYDLSAGKWSTYVEVSTSATTPTTPAPTTATQAPTSGGDGVTVYLKNEAGWSTPSCYMWNSGNDSNKAWPGEAMTSIGDDVYMYTASKSYKNCIFNSGSDQNKTGDLTTMDGQIYNNKTNTWSVYDLSDLQVKSFKADPATGVYVDTAVTLSAEAQNKNGAEVSYKFSVTNANGGTSVISDYSSVNSVVWTPQTAGTYTITFDFKDTEGNENSRTATVKVDDDSALVKPVIKSVFPADKNLIKVNTAATVSVKAGGGKTGTNLLFYKYIVTDPNGVKNTPYYTLNSTYSFTPRMLGEYTVNVYVQGSDNSTVNKTYKYTATNSDVTVPTTPVPTTTAPVPTTTVPVPTTTAPVPTTTAPFVLGDVDGDGILTIKDATYIQKYLAEYTEFSSISLKVGDVDGDGRISIKDATSIQSILAN